MCGASSQQNQLEQSQSNFYNQMTTQASQIFGQQSGIYQDLVNTFAPTVAAGPNQQGFSPQELSNLNSEAITQAGQSYKNEKEALGDQQAAAGGGRSVLPGGATVGADASLAENAGNLTANELGQITQQNYATGRQNYLQATQGLAGAGNVLGIAENANSGAVGAGNSAANTANQIAQENNSWVQAVTGALGGIGGAAVTGGLNYLANGAGSAASVGSLGDTVSDNLNTQSMYGNVTNSPLNYSTYGGGSPGWEGLGGAAYQTPLDPSTVTGYVPTRQ